MCKNSRKRRLPLHPPPHRGAPRLRSPHPTAAPTLAISSHSHPSPTPALLSPPAYREYATCRTHQPPFATLRRLPTPHLCPRSDLHSGTVHENSRRPHPICSGTARRTDHHPRSARRSPPHARPTSRQTHCFEAHREKESTQTTITTDFFALYLVRLKQNTYLCIKIKREISS